jgi:predicted oxidoreductase
MAGAVKDLIQEGKVKHFGLSEADAATIRQLLGAASGSPKQVQARLARNMAFTNGREDYVEVRLAKLGNAIRKKIGVPYTTQQRMQKATDTTSISPRHSRCFPKSLSSTSLYHQFIT